MVSAEVDRRLLTSQEVEEELSRGNSGASINYRLLRDGEIKTPRVGWEYIVCSILFAVWGDTRGFGTWERELAIVEKVVKRFHEKSGSDKRLPGSGERVVKKTGRGWFG